MNEIAQKLSFRNRTQEIILMSGAQMGKTTLCLNFIDYVVRFGSGNLMYVMPTDGSVKNFSRVRLSKTLEFTEDISGEKLEKGSRKRNNTMLTKKFATGYLILTGANSPIGLRAMPIKYLLMDEVDAFPENVGSEGDPVFLATKRTSTFVLRRKIFMVSTPTIEETSRIEKNYNVGTKKKYYVPCPHCHYKQVLDFEKLVYDKDNLNNIKYKCQKCLNEIEEYNKNYMLENGVWIAENPKSKIESYHINSLYSPLGWYSWSDIIKDYLKASDNLLAQISFINTVLAETVKSSFGETIDINFVYHANTEKYDFEVPDGVLAITAGVDVQDDRFAVEIVGWGIGQESWSLLYKEIKGDLDDEKVWEKLDNLLLKKFITSKNKLRRVNCVCVDHGGHYSQAVEKFCKNRERRRVYAVKGSSNTNAEIIQSATRRNVSKTLLYLIGTVKIKDILFRRLNLKNPGFGYCHFPDTYNEEYFNMLTSEKKVRQVKKNKKKEYYVKTRKRNEALDCRVYAYAALNILNPNFQIIAEKQLKRTEEPEKKEKIIEKLPKKKKKFNFSKKTGWLYNY
jgi:phage terminase large subunit GpA-like protein